jgi:XTP/dITP diphosphohydrolase
MMYRDCQHLVLATRNPHKLAELTGLLAEWPVALGSLADYPGAMDVDEQGATSAENAALKAAGYARQISQWVLADDTELVVDALGGAPGVRTARYAGPQATTAENRARLLADLIAVPDSLRTARFVGHLALADPAGNIVVESTGTCEGRIRRAAADGGYGFGYDVLFEVSGLGRTLAELDPTATARAGHRGLAVRALLAQLRQQQG